MSSVVPPSSPATSTRPYGLHLKRTHGESDDELDIKRKYYYVLAPEAEGSVDGTESISSIQDKSTDFAKDTSDSFSGSSSETFRVQLTVDFEADLSSSTEDENGSKQDISSDESLTRDISLWSKTLFQRCLKCGEPNSIPYFRYCRTCYLLRKTTLPARPISKKSRTKSVLSTKDVLGSTTEDSGIGSSTKQISNYCEEGSFGDLLSNSELCQICMVRQKDGGFCHGKILHVYACYKCSVRTFKQSGRCPVCNVNTSQVYKIFSG